MVMTLSLTVFDNFRYGLRSMAPVGSCAVVGESRFGGAGSLPRHCKGPTDYTRIRLLPAGDETDMLSVSSDEEPQTKESNNECMDVPSALGLVDIPMPVSFNAEEVHLLPAFFDLWQMHRQAEFFGQFSVVVVLFWFAVVEGMEAAAFQMAEDVAGVMGAGPKASWKMKLPVKKSGSSKQHQKEARKLYGSNYQSSWKSRIKPPDLLKLLVFYARSNRLKSPKVSDAMSHLKLGKNQVQHIYIALLSQEATAGRKFCAQKQNLFGQLEGDAHTIRKIYVSKTNPEFQDEIQDAMGGWKAQKPGKPEPKYWLGHVRIAGIKARAAATVVVVLPYQLSMSDDLISGSDFLEFISIAADTEASETVVETIGCKRVRSVLVHMCMLAMEPMLEFSKGPVIGKSWICSRRCETFDLMLWPPETEETGGLQHASRLHEAQGKLILDLLKGGPNRTGPSAEAKAQPRHHRSGGAFVPAVLLKQGELWLDVSQRQLSDDDLLGILTDRFCQAVHDKASTSRSIAPDMWYLNIDVSQNRLTGRGISLLLDLFERLNGTFRAGGRPFIARILRLYKNHLGDPGALQVARFITVQRAPLHELHLSHNEIGQEGAEAILRAFGTHPTRSYPFQLLINKSLFGACWVRLEHNVIPDPSGLLKAIGE
ncbi:unnamed protein product, partial [Symbiodinium sp. KB8]